MGGAHSFAEVAESFLESVGPRQQGTRLFGALVIATLLLIRRERFFA
jgi:hypothetical protein